MGYLFAIVVMIIGFVGMKEYFKEKTGSGCLGYFIAGILALIILGSIFLR